LLSDDERLVPLGRLDSEPGSNRVQVASLRKPEYRVVVPGVVHAGRRGLARRQWLDLGGDCNRRRGRAAGLHFQVGVVPAKEQFL
jgi:hypothetical protein